MKTKTSGKTKSNLPVKARRSLKLVDLKPKKNPKGGASARLQPIQDGTSNTIMLKSG